MNDLEFNSSEYYSEVGNLASDLYDEALAQNGNHSGSAMDAIQDGMLHELVDGHQWVIYTYSNELVARFSSNSEAYLDYYDNETIAQIVSDKGLDAVKPIIAYFAMYQDVSEALDELEAVQTGRVTAA